MGKTYIADKETLDKCYAILSADGIYGFIEHMDILSPTARIEYIGQNKDFTPISLNKDTGTMTLNSWADFPIIVANKPWMVRADGTPDYRLDENDYTKKEDGTASDVSNTSYNGGAFSWLAKIYKQEYMLGNDRVVKFSMRERDGFEPVGFKDPSNNVLEGVWIPMFYGSILGADTSTPKMVSLAGLQPCYNNTTDKEHTASTRRKRELATSIAQQKYNDMIARRYFCQLAYTNFGESDWAVTFTYDHDHQPAPGDFNQVDRDWTNFTRRLKRFCKKTGREASKWMQVAEYSVVDEDGKVTGRHHHHVILQGNLTWQEIKDLWRDSTGRPMGLVKIEPIDLTCSSFERLTTYMTKARARIRRWRQSQGLQKPKTPRPNDTRWSRKRFDEAFALPDDREYWEKKYPGYTLRECEQHITGNNTKHLILKLKKKPETRRKNRRNQP